MGEGLATSGIGFPLRIELLDAGLVPRATRVVHAPNSLAEESARLKRNIKEHEERLQSRPDDEMTLSLLQLDLTMLGLNQRLEGKTTEQLETYRKQVEIMTRLLATRPNDSSLRNALAMIHNGLAWTLATHVDETIRNGKEAVEHAQIACKLTDWSDFAAMDTLAAAYAETSDFDIAVEHQSRACDLAPDAQKAEAVKRLELYKSKVPYRALSPIVK
jgi:tetratricopeptide (TPR) repeat protein